METLDLAKITRSFELSWYVSKKKLKVHFTFLSFRPSIFLFVIVHDKNK